MTGSDDRVDADRNDAGLLAQVRTALALLERFADDAALRDRLPPEERERLHRCVGRIFSPDPVQRRKQRRAAARERSKAQICSDDGVLHQTGIRELRRKPVFTTPNVFPPAGPAPHDVQGDDPDRREALEPQHCYVCKEKYTRIHHFYDQLCPSCAEFNFHKRGELADLRGRVALLTGGRVKIGYQAGLKLLRAGAHLIVTTRFPRDSAERYAQEPDFEQWQDRLEIFGLDLRHTPSVEAFCQQLLDTRPRLDFIINNACQTVRRPPEFYAHMMAGETALREAPERVRRLLGSYRGMDAERLRAERAAGTAVSFESRGRVLESAQLSQIPLLPEEFLAQSHLFPEGRLDQ
ncbi:MAG: oxidoreductase, partial [Gammaproteobacteria bacterium HGW-Gammaproteobacteria-7]